MWKRKKERKEEEEKKDPNFFSGTWIYEIWLRQIHQIKFSQHSVHWDSGSMWSKFSPVWMATSNLSVYFNFKPIELFSCTPVGSLIVPKMTDKELSPRPLSLTPVGMAWLDWASVYWHFTSMGLKCEVSYLLFPYFLGFVWLHFRCVQY